MRKSIQCQFSVGLGIFWFCATSCFAQVDPFHRNLIHVGVDQPLVGHSPQGIYAYYYFNNPEIHGTNTALRMAVAPLYFDSELGFKQLLSENTDVGFGIFGGAFADNYYEVRQGLYRKEESFDGNSGGAAIGLYHLLNPSMLIPLNFVTRAGVRYVAFEKTSDTARTFRIPDNQSLAFVRTGLRLGGKEPVLDPELGLELSVWYEHQWRTDGGTFGYAGERDLASNTDLYWLYAGISYRWTNIGHQVSFAMTAGGSSGTDLLNSWRLGGVLPLVSEFPLVIPGYFYQEVLAERFLHFYTAYMIPLEPSHHFELRLEAAAAQINTPPGYELRDNWQTGVGAGLAFTPRERFFRIVLRYGYGFEAQRKDHFGSHSIGLLFQYDFERHPLKWRPGF